MSTEPKANSAYAEYQRLVELGAEHHRAKRHQVAERYYLSAVRHSPSRNDAQRLLAILYLETGSQTRAQALFRQLLKADIRDPHQLHEIGLGFEKLNTFAEAREALTRAIAIDPTFTDARLTLGAVLTKHSETDEAIHTYERCHELAPRDARPLAELARLFVFEGRFGEAEACSRKALALDPENVNAMAFLARSRKFALGDPILQQMQRTLSKTGLPPYEKRLLHQAIGKIHDECGEFDTAFRHFTEGNAIRDKEYSHAVQRERWNALRSLFTREFLDRHRELGHPSTRPIFIVGMPRSGTSLVEQVLSSHASVFGGGELALMNAIASQAADFCPGTNSYPHCLNALTHEGARSLARQYLSGIDLYNRSSAHVTDKYPHNFEHIGLIALLFSNAKIIYCKRNPLDVGVSIFFNLMSSPYPWSASLEDIADHYDEHTKLMSHWFDVLQDRIIKIVYEDFVSEFEQQSRRLVSACGLEWDDACLRYAKTQRSVRTPSAWQVRQPVSRSSIGKWRHYQNHLGSLLRLADGEIEH